MNYIHVLFDLLLEITYRLSMGSAGVIHVIINPSKLSSSRRWWTVATALNNQHLTVLSWPFDVESQKLKRVGPVTFLCVLYIYFYRPNGFSPIVASRSYDIAIKTVAPRWHRPTKCVPFSYRSKVYDELMPQYIDVPPWATM